MGDSHKQVPNLCRGGNFVYSRTWERFFVSGGGNIEVIGFHKLFSAIPETPAYPVLRSWTQILFW